MKAEPYCVLDCTNGALGANVRHDFTICKICNGTAVPKYHIGRVGKIYECAECHVHYLDSLDEVPDLALPPPIPDDTLRRHFAYVDQILHANTEKFRDKVALVRAHRSLENARCLDIGAGGGLFASLLEAEGAEVQGIEPDPLNRAFARDRFQLAFDPRLVEDPFWQDAHRATMDVVTLWDVIEHVNFPLQTLAAAVKLLVPGGFLFLDTPARDGLLYRGGEWLYRCSGGRSTRLLAAQYSRAPFGHKQIFTTHQLATLMRSLGLVPIAVRSIHELSFPYRTYLQQLLRSRIAARAAEPLAHLFFAVVPIRNKMILAMRLERASDRL